MNKGLKEINNKVNKQKSKVQRGRGEKSAKVIKMFTTNAAGLNSKINSLSAQLKKLDIQVFTVQ